MTTTALRPPRAILFDWDNTLVDSWATIHDALNFLMRAMGKPEWSLAETRERVRLSLREAFPLYFGERWEEARDIYLNRFREIHLDRLTVLPGRSAMLRQLAGQGIYLGIVSNKTGALLRREVARLGWAEMFGSIVGAGDAPADKPAPDPVHLALAPSGVPAGSEVWFVGDTGDRHGMCLEQRLRRNSVRRRGRNAWGVCPVCAAPIVCRWRKPVSYAGGLALRRRGPIFVGDTARPRPSLFRVRAGRRGSNNDGETTHDNR